MNKEILLYFVILTNLGFLYAQEGYITRQGEVSFFSYTSVENIEATNIQTRSVLYPSSNKIGVQILMRAFTFEKSLMYEHFNESYVESDLYPRALFQGEIIDFNPEQQGEQTRIIKGDFTLRDKTKNLEIKATISKTPEGYQIKGSFEVVVDDYNIRIPSILAPNIAENIEVRFNFSYVPNDEQK
jgi:hypothetical protein